MASSDGRSYIGGTPGFYNNQLTSGIGSMVAKPAVMPQPSAPTVMPQAPVRDNVSIGQPAPMAPPQMSKWQQHMKEMAPPQTGGPDPMPRVAQEQPMKMGAGFPGGPPIAPPGYDQRAINADPQGFQDHMARREEMMGQQMNNMAQLQGPTSMQQPGSPGKGGRPSQPGSPGKGGRPSGPPQAMPALGDMAGGMGNATPDQGPPPGYDGSGPGYHGPGMGVMGGPPTGPWANQQPATPGKGGGMRQMPAQPPAQAPGSPMGGKGGGMQQQPAQPASPGKGGMNQSPAYGSRRSRYGGGSPMGGKGG